VKVRGHGRGHQAVRGYIHSRPTDERSDLVCQARVARPAKERTGVAATGSTAVPAQARGQVLHTVEPEVVTLQLCPAQRERTCNELPSERTSVTSPPSPGTSTSGGNNSRAARVSKCCRMLLPTALALSTMLSCPGTLICTGQNRMR